MIPRLRDLLVAGGAARLPAQIVTTEGAAVPLGDQLAGRTRQRLTTEVVDAKPSVQVRAGQSAAQLAAAYVKSTMRPWSQPIGFQHALFEVAIDVLKRAKAPEPKAILESIIATNYNSIVGHVQWTGKPVKNVTKTPLVAGQWQRRGDRFELVITANRPAPEIPVGGKLELLS
jgi:branched-chain amino acid transport system substrate-binding protein